MAGNGMKRGGSSGGDVVLESRHLVGLFVMMVVIFGAVFLLGYELGRNQVGGQVRAAQTPGDNAGVAPSAQPELPAVDAGAAPQPAGHSPAGHGSAAPSPAKSPAASSKKGPAQPPASNKTANSANPAPGKAMAGKSQPVPSPKATGAQPSPGLRQGAAGTSPSGGAANPPLIPKGSIMLQVSAMSKEADALREAQELQSKHFPAFVIPPGADRFYHVQVGPYADAKAAEKAKAALEQEGFKPIVKH